MKLMSSARTIEAAISRSPSFSRSSSSITTTMRPARRSASTASMGSRRSPSSFSSVTFDKSVLLQALPRQAARLVVALADQTLQVARHDVHFQVHPGTISISPEARGFQGMRHDVHAEGVAFHLVDRQAHAVHADRTLAGEVARQLRRHADAEAHRASVVHAALHLADAVH